MRSSFIMRMSGFLLVSLTLLLLFNIYPSLHPFSRHLPFVSSALAEGSASYSLVVSRSPDRSNPFPLANSTLLGNVYIITSPDTTDISRVRFYLDDVNRSGKPRQVESNPPYDFAGGSASTAYPFDTTKVPDGSHTVTAAIEFKDGSTQVIHAAFTVANSGPILMFQPGSLTFSLSEGDAGSATATLGTSNGTSTSYNLIDDAAWLTASPSSGATPATINILVDATGLPAGAYNTTITASATGYTSAILAVRLSVNRAFDQVHLAWTSDPSTSLTIVWRTWSLTTASTVQYRPAGSSSWLSASGSLRSSSTTGTLHEVTVFGLIPSTIYEYRVQGDGGKWSEIFTTRTAPPAGPADFDVIYVADTGLVGRADGLATGTRQVIDEIAALNPLFVLPGGDYIYYDTDKRYGSLANTIDAWFNQMQPVASRSPLMPTYGNHEVLLEEDYQSWADRFPTPQGLDGRRNYSFDVGDVHFLSIFAVYNSVGLTSSQLSWIEQDISAARSAGQRWIIPYFHVSPFADGTNHPSNLKLRQQLGPIFERLGVKLVISSHDQAYERTYPLINVPATNTPTSTSLTCYTLNDGVTWVKTSPGGKLSNINKGFSSFATNPPPAWTAYRNNTLHHFSRLVVSAAGSIRLDTYGVKGDGSAPIIIDSFKYTTGSCGPELVIGAEDLSFNLTKGEKNSQTLTLDTNNGTAANFTVSDDAAWLTISPASGTTPAILTVTADATGLSSGTYQATITATAPGYASDSRSVTLTVTEENSGSYKLLVSLSSNRLNPVPLHGMTVSGNIYVFTSPDTAEIVRVRFYLDDPNMTGKPRSVESNAPYDFAGGSGSTANPFKTTSIANGLHTITSAVDLTNGGTQVIHATFTVNN